MNVKEVTVSIMGKQYRIACPPGQEQALQQAAAAETLRNSCSRYSKSGSGSSQYTASLHTLQLTLKLYLQPLDQTGFVSKRSGAVALTRPKRAAYS